MVAHLSLELAASRMVARHEASIHVLSRALSFWFVAASLLSVSIALAVGLSFRDSILAGASAQMVTTASLTIPALFATQLAGQLLIVRGRLVAHGLSAALGAVVQLAVTLYLLVTNGLTPSSALVSATIGFGAVGLLMVLALARDIGKGALLPFPDRLVMRRLLNVGLRLHPGSVALQLDPRVSLLLVGALLTAADAGQYSLALSLMGTVLLATQALSVSAVHTQYAEMEAHATRFTLEFARQSFLLSVIGAGLMAAAAYPMIVLLYGSAFAEATIPFVILLIATVAIAIENPCRVLLTRISRPLFVSGMVTGAIALNVLATVVLVELLSVAGAALATAVSYWVLTLMMLRVASKRGHRPMREVVAPPRRDDEVVRLIGRGLARFRHPFSG